MRVHLATDHAGLELKEEIRVWLQSEGIGITDHGTFTIDPEDDFPDFISQAAEAVSKSRGDDRAIIFGGSGQGEAMLANRFPYVRAVVFYGGDTTIPKLSRQHNDSNVLSLGARFVDQNLAKQVVWEWLHTDVLSDEKYHRRNKKIESYSS